MIFQPVLLDENGRNQSFRILFFFFQHFFS